MGLFRPFYPQIGEFGWAGSYSTSNNLKFMVINISSLIMNKSKGHFLLKWVDWKDGIFSFFWQKNPVKTYWGLQGAKNRPPESGWLGTDRTGVLIVAPDDDDFMHPSLS